MIAEMRLTDIDRIRGREKDYHDDIYLKNELFAPGSWLHRPVPFVMNSFKLINGNERVNALDIGCGVGRHSIPLAGYLGSQGKVVCVDILESAISRLVENAKKHGVSENIIPVLSDIEDYETATSEFNYILSVSGIEHSRGEDKLRKKIRDLQDATAPEGVHCFCMMSDNEFTAEDTSVIVEHAIETNLRSADVVGMLNELYADWHIMEISKKRWTAKQEIAGIPHVLNSTCVQFLGANGDAATP